MSTLKTHNLQSPDASSVNIALTPNSGAVISGITTITKGTSGGATANTDSVLILDNSSHSYIQFRTPNNKEQGILFGDDADNDAGNIIYDHSDNALTFATNGGTNERLRISSDGVVSWKSGSTPLSGTSNDYSLHIYRDSGSGYGYIDTITNGSNHTGIRIRAYHNGTYNNVFEHTTGDFTRFYTGGGERLRITGNGRFGLNNNSPQYAMHLSPEVGQSRIDLHMTNDTTGHNNNRGVQFGYQNSGGAYIWNFEDTNIYFGTNNISRLIIETSSSTTFNFRPNTNNVCSLGTNSHRWANIHTNDLNLSNEGSVNEVDGTWGQYTIQEGEHDLFLINRRSGKRYKFLLQEVN